MIRIMIIENDVSYCEALHEILCQDKEIEVIGAYNDAESAFICESKNEPDIVLVDIDLGPGKTNGIECIKILKSKYSLSNFMILTVYEDHQKVFDALSAGALGYILKSSRPEKILSAVHDLAEGGSPMSPSIARKLVLSFNQTQTVDSDQASLLTQREIEIIELISKGLLEKEVASELYISIKTVKSHISHIYSKLQVRTRVEALNKYYGRK